MKNWITTVGGVLAAVGTIASQAVPAPYSWIPALIAAIGSAMIGGGAKDFNVHSTSDEVRTATAEAINK